MGKDRRGVFKLVQGLKPVNEKDLEAFERGMREEAVPKIIKDVENRRMLAAESRQRRLEMPRAEKPEKGK